MNIFKSNFAFKPDDAMLAKIKSGCVAECSYCFCIFCMLHPRVINIFTFIHFAFCGKKKKKHKDAHTLYAFTFKHTNRASTVYQYCALLCTTEQAAYIQFNHNSNFQQKFQILKITNLFKISGFYMYYIQYTHLTRHYFLFILPTAHE